MSAMSCCCGAESSEVAFQAAGIVFIDSNSVIMMGVAISMVIIAFSWWTTHSATRAIKKEKHEKDMQTNRIPVTDSWTQTGTEISLARVIEVPDFPPLRA